MRRAVHYCDLHNCAHLDASGVGLARQGQIVAVEIEAAELACRHLHFPAARDLITLRIVERNSRADRFGALYCRAWIGHAKARRLDAREMEAGGAPTASYFLNFNGLDRLNRLGVKFVFDGASKQFRYDGAAWREIITRHPRSPEAAEARRRLDSVGRR